MKTQEQFYKSKAWLDFRKVLINERTDTDGFVHCNKCGKAIIHKYDLIVHHRIELNDNNVNDVNISLNPDNCECICFSCHNKEHDRFGDKRSTGHKPVQKKVYIVYGSPCSGKSTWVKENATADDLVVDLDNIWQMISINDRYDKPATLKSVVFEVRDKLYDTIKYRSGKWKNAFIITGGALIGDRQRLKQRVSADEFIFIDTSFGECMKRVKTKGLNDEQQKLWISYIHDWFEKFQKDELSDN